MRIMLEIEISVAFVYLSAGSAPQKCFHPSGEPNIRSADSPGRSSVYNCITSVPVAKHEIQAKTDLLLFMKS